MSAYKDRATMGVMLGLLAMYFVFAALRGLSRIGKRRMRAGDAGHTEATMYAGMLGMDRAAGFNSRRALMALRRAKPHPLRQ